MVIVGTAAPLHFPISVKFILVFIKGTFIVETPKESYSKIEKLDLCSLGTCITKTEDG